MDMHEQHREVCSICGLDRGAHKGAEPMDQCPAHQSGMDWPKEHMTTFRSTGVFADVPYRQRNKNLAPLEPAQEDGSC